MKESEANVTKCFGMEAAEFLNGDEDNFYKRFTKTTYFIDNNVRVAIVEVFMRINF